MIDLHHLQQLLPHTMFELASDLASVVAIATPLWLPYLKEVSEVSGYLLPLLGVVLLTSRIGLTWYNHFKGRPER